MSAQQLITDHLDLWTDAVTHKSGSGRSASGKNGKIELTGIKKLRELILELAVRGKLVEQDPNDEPASVLLDRIAEEKTRLVKEGKIKKPKRLPDIAEEEKPFELPWNWSWVRLGNISQVNPRNGAEDDLEASFIPMPLISTSYNGVHGQELRPWREMKKGYTHIADGDIAIAKITPCFENSKAAIFNNLKNGIGAGTTELHVARSFGNTLDPHYVLLCLKSPRFLSNGERKMTGSAGQKRVPKDFFAGEPLPFAPLPEQHRIVEKVDELMALCDHLEQQVGDQLEAHEVLVDTLLDALTRSADADEVAEHWARVAEHFDTLFTTEASIDKLKQTILQLSVMGRLVEQDPNDEPARVLLERIAEEKDRLVQERKIKKPKTLPEIADEEKPFGLPEGWTWARMEAISEYIQRGKGPTYAESGKVRVISQKCVQWSGLDLSTARFVDNSSLSGYKNERYIRKNDILWNSTGTGTVGRANVVEEPQPSIVVDSHVTVVRPLAAEPHHILNYISSPSVQQRIEPNHENSLVSGTTKQVELNSGSVKLLAVPLPPLNEQQRIVKKVDELMALCDQLKARLSKASETRAQLAETVVEQAVS